MGTRPKVLITAFRLWDSYRPRYRLPTSSTNLAHLPRPAASLSPRHWTLLYVLFELSALNDDNISAVDHAGSESQMKPDLQSFRFENTNTTGAGKDDETMSPMTPANFQIENEMKSRNHGPELTSRRDSLLANL
jgi:hypothetical protein